MDEAATAGTIRFRDLIDTDLEVLHRLHGDPATNEHNPFGASPDRAATGRMAAEWIDHVRIHGFGYRLAVDGAGEVIGVGGARVDVWRGAPVVNLYWRLLPEHWGRGLAHPLAAGDHSGADAGPADLVGPQRRRRDLLGHHRRRDRDRRTAADRVQRLRPVGPVRGGHRHHGRAQLAGDHRLLVCGPLRPRVGDRRRSRLPGTAEPRFADFIYLSVQVTTTFASSDVQLTATGARKLVALHSIVAFAFNSVIVALLVSVLISAVN